MEVGSLFRPVRLRLLLIPLLLLLAFVIYYPFSPAAQQQRRMETGQQHVPIIEAALAPYSSEELQVGVSTENLGTILVHSEAGDEATATAIHDAVRATNPPITTRVSILGPDGQRWVQETIEPQ